MRRYDGDHLGRISLPLGGIGTGTIGLGGRGDLRDFEVGNRPAKGFRPATAFFAIRARRDGERPVARLLEGPVGISEFEGPFGATAGQHGFPRYAHASFEAAYPFGQVVLEDEQLPRVVVRGFNPLIPGDLQASSLPVAILCFEVAGEGTTPLEVTVAGSIENFVGANGSVDDLGGNLNEALTADGLVGIRMLAPELDPDHEAAGSSFWQRSPTRRRPSRLGPPGATRHGAERACASGTTFWRTARWKSASKRNSARSARSRTRR